AGYQAISRRTAAVPSFGRQPPSIPREHYLGRQITALCSRVARRPAAAKPTPDSAIGALFSYAFPEELVRIDLGPRPSSARACAAVVQVPPARAEDVKARPSDIRGGLGLPC